MGIKIDIETQGFKEIDKALQKLPLNVEKRVLNKSLLGAMRVGAKLIKQAAPVHSGKQSAASKQFRKGKVNIKAKRMKSRKRQVKAAQINTGNAFWLMIYELGSRFQPARPFFLPAFTAATGLILKDFRDRLKKGIEEETRKLRNGN